MMRISFTLFFTLLTLFAATVLDAQTAPAPAPELKKLNFLVGDWTATGTANPGPGMPGGKFSSSSHFEWMEGNYFLVSHGDFDLPGMGRGKEIAVFGYDPDRKAYTYNAFNSMGQAESATGKIDGDTWTWLSEEHFGGMSMKGRFTMKVLSPTSYTMKFELSPDGTSWNPGMEGKATKK